MSVFDIISLLGGLAMFLYGMRLMGDSLKEGSSGTLKKVMEKVTNNPLKAFLLGVVVTAIIQSSTATIVITSGLVAAEIISLHQSLGIIIGANVGTTVTGQIIRLLDVDASGTSWLNIFKPSTLAPIALIIGMVLIMGFKFKKSNNIGKICIGFGILFMGLLSMTNSVNALSESGMIDEIFASLGDNLLLGYVVGAAVAFVLQSSSATIGILQAFAMAGVIPFKTIFIVLVGIYLGDCVTTAIVCSIGAKANQRRVGIVNILFNLSETVLVVLVVGILHLTGVIGSEMWNMPMTPGTIANTNTIFNLGCAILLLPMINVYEFLSKKIVRDSASKAGEYSELLAGLNPAFLKTPALAFNACYDVLRSMLKIARENTERAFNLIEKYDAKLFDKIDEEEQNLDTLTDCVGNYMAQLAPYINHENEEQINILKQYNKAINDFERLGDHAVNLAETADHMNENGIHFSSMAVKELAVTRELINKIYDYATKAFEKRDYDAARNVEPLEDVMDDMVSTLHDNHIERLNRGLCTVPSGTAFLDILSNLERISDLCSNIGIAVVARINPETAALAHTYVTALHSGTNKDFEKNYNEYHKFYFDLLSEAEKTADDGQMTLDLLSGKGANA